MGGRKKNQEMHFWIDKRSPFGNNFGYNRSLAGLSYQHRRIRSKSTVTPFRPISHTQSNDNRSAIPSTSHVAPKSHYHHRHHRHHRQGESSIRIVSSSNSQHENGPSHSSAQQHHIQITANVPVTVYHRDELPVNHVVDSLDDTTIRSHTLSNQWLPIYLKFGICCCMAIILIVLKLYYDNELTKLQLLTFGTMTIIFLAFSTTVSILKMHKNRMLLPEASSAATEVIVDPVLVQLDNNQDMSDNPPPYNIAIKFPEKISHYSEAPPAYDKIFK